ncbi:MAG: shikimate kinase [bacterium]|nr:shikimate kinase [bacterium]
MWTSFVGFMGSGKSTVTRLLCNSTNRPLAVCDELAEARAGRSVADIFAAEGEDGFRALEVEVLQDLDPCRSLVIDTGGGAVETPAAVALLRERGVVVWLDAPWIELLHRLRGNGEAGKRPLVEELGWDGLEQLHRRRQRLYAAAADFRLRVEDAEPAAVARTAMLRSLLWERQREAAER